MTKQQHKAIIEEEMVYNPEGFTDNSTMKPIQSVTMKKTCSRKSIRQF